MPVLPAVSTGWVLQRNNPPIRMRIIATARKVQPRHPGDSWFMVYQTATWLSRINPARIGQGGGRKTNHRALDPAILSRTPMCR
jgi:hypothetical protein